MQFDASGQVFKFQYLGEAKKKPDKLELLFVAVTELLKEHDMLTQKDLLSTLKENGIATSEHVLRKSLNLWVENGALPKPVKNTKGNSLHYHIESTENENE